MRNIYSLALSRKALITHVENKRVDAKGERGDRTNWEIGVGVHSLLTLCIK